MTIEPTNAADNAENVGGQAGLDNAALVAKLTAERDAARAECERLREELEALLSANTRLRSLPADADVEGYSLSALVAAKKNVGFAERRARAALAPKEPAPVVAAATDSGWPRWWHLPDSGYIHCAYSPDAKAIWYRADGTAGECLEDTGRSMITHERFYKPITPAEAAAWLRANGHPGVADEMEKKG